MASLALLWRRLVEKHLLAFDQPNLLVATSTTDVLVQTLQGKGRPLVMIEQRRLPLGTVVTLNTRRNAVPGELPAMNLLMTALALGGRRSEVGGYELGLQVGRLMAIDASRSFVRSDQGKRRLRVVEPREFFPGFCGVASLTPEGRSVGAKLLHAFRKLPFVRIFVTGRAREIFPVIEDNRLGPSFYVRSLFVAIATGNGHVTTG